jgi:hypothetical protein
MTAPDPALVETVAAHMVGWFELANARGPGEVAARLKQQTRGYTGTGPDGAHLSYMGDASGIEVSRSGWAVDTVRITHHTVARWAWSKLDEHDRAQLAELNHARGRAIGALWDDPSHTKQLQRPDTLTGEERAHLARLGATQHSAEKAMRRIVADAFTATRNTEPAQLDLFTVG